MTRAVLITGGGKRLGQFACEKFASEGWHVIVHYNRSVEDAQALVTRIGSGGGSASAVGFDLSDTRNIPDFAVNVARDHPGWSCLINNAAMFDYDSPEAIDQDVWAKAMAVNCLAPVQLASSFVEHSQADGDRSVINILDQKLANLNPDFFSYTVAKGGLKVASEMMAMAFAKSGVRVCNVGPGLSLPSGDQTEEEYQTSSIMNLLMRQTQISEIVDTIHFMATNAALTGQTVYVDSGQHRSAQPRDVMFMIRGEQ